METNTYHGNREIPYVNLKEAIRVTKQNALKTESSERPLKDELKPNQPTKTWGFSIITYIYCVCVHARTCVPVVELDKQVQV